MEPTARGRSANQVSNMEDELMIAREIREATERGEDCPRWGAVDTDDDLTAEEVYCLAVDGRPGVGKRTYRDCATGVGDSESEALLECDLATR